VKYFNFSNSPNRLFGTPETLKEHFQCYLLLFQRKARRVIFNGSPYWLFTIKENSNFKDKLTPTPHTPSTSPTEQTMTQSTTSTLKSLSTLQGLFLDDERNPEDITWLSYPSRVNWITVRDYTSFCSALQEHSFNIMSFDHDLGTDKNGADCAKALIELHISNNKPLPLTYIHSKNPIGSSNIESLLNSAQKILSLNI